MTVILVTIVSFNCYLRDFKKREHQKGETGGGDNG